MGGSISATSSSPPTTSTAKWSSMSGCPAADAQRRPSVEGRDELRFEELRSDLHDLTDAITGLGIELEAINMSVRAFTAHVVGEDPLRNHLYYGGAAGERPGPRPPARGNAGGEREASEEKSD